MTILARLIRALLGTILGVSALTLAGCGGGSSGPAYHTVGGSVSGLTSADSLILKDNDGDAITVSSNGSFTFPTPVAAGSSFGVTIASQIPGKTCTADDASGSIASSDITTIRIVCGPAKYTIGGSLSGLAPGTSVVLSDNGGDPLTLSANAAFTFSTSVTAGNTYAVTITTQPADQTCVVSGGSGTATDTNVTSLQITCSATTYTISGTVTGLAEGTEIVVQNNGTDPVHVSTNSSFTFAVSLTSGSHYAVTIATQPLYQSCTVTAGSGTVTDAPISNVLVHCPFVVPLWSFGFGNDGSSPNAGLILGSDGNLYGTTTYGSSSLWGSVYKYIPSYTPAYAAGGTETVLAGFAAGTDGDRPWGALLEASDGNFYGTTYVGGAHNAGTVFKVTPSGQKTLLYSFAGGSDGGTPKSALIQGSDGNLYGTTTGGGAFGGGTVFKLTLAGLESIIWSFGSGTDGADPENTVTQGADGNLYGVTALGGTQGRGIIFKLTLAGVETIFHHFDYTTGSLPSSDLLLASDGNFYGTTAAGGSSGGGTFFKLTLTGAVSVIWNFGAGLDGAFPTGSLAEGHDGNFYGTTRIGGSISGDGTLYRLTPDGAETVLWDFGYGGNGSFPSPNGLTQGPDGNFYGTTVTGGTTAKGFIFRLIP